MFLTVYILWFVMKPKWNNTPLCGHEPENPCILLEIHYRKNLAKLKGAAVRITGNKPEGKNYDERKKHRQKHKKGRYPCPDVNLDLNFLQRRKWGLIRLGHATTARFKIVKINTFEVFFSAIHTVGTLRSCNYHELKDAFEGKKA